MKQALQIIIAKSPQAASEAMDCLKAIRAKSPIVQSRYERTVQSAFADPQAEFTSQERALIASYLDGEDDSSGTAKMRSVKLSDDDWARAWEIGDGNASAGIRRALKAYQN